MQEIPNECYSDADDMIVSDGADSYRDANVGNRYYYSTATGNLTRVKTYDYTTDETISI